MATALSRQLAQLQSESRLGKGGRASLLFTPREAEDYDIPTVFAIGVNGLEELTLKDGRFAAFEEDLFSDSWRDTDRELAPPEFNASVTSRVSAFLALASPHLLTKAATKAMEWLVRRFKVHVYDVDAVMEAALPHHDSALFSRLLSLFPLGTSSSVLGPGSSSLPLWGFLSASASATAAGGVPRDVFVRQCVKDAGVLRFIVGAAGAAALRAGEGSGDAAAFSQFYTLVACETVRAVPTVSDALAALLLGSVSRGIKSGARCRDFQVANYAVASALAARVVFSPSVFDSIVAAVASSVVAPPQSSHSSSGSVEGGGGVTSDKQQQRAAVHIGGEVADAAATREAVLALLALFSGQHAAQHAVGLVVGAAAAAAADDDADESSSSSTRAEIHWLGGYVMRPRAVRALAKVPNFAAVLGTECAQFDGAMFVRCLLLSCLAVLPKGPDLVRFFRALLHACPAPTLAPLCVGMTRAVLGLYRVTASLSVSGTSTDTASAAAVTSTSTAEAEGTAVAAASVDTLAEALRALAGLFPDAVDAGLAIELNRRPRSSSLSASDADAVVRGAGCVAAGRDMPSAGVIAWASSVLAGSGVAVAAAADDQAHGASSSSASSLITLSLALVHGSEVVRSRAMHSLGDAAETTLMTHSSSSSRSSSSSNSARAAAAVATSTSNHTSEPPTSTSDPSPLDSLLRVSIPALERGLTDDGCAVVEEALRAHDVFLRADVVAVRGANHSTALQQQEQQQQSQSPSDAVSDAARHAYQAPSLAAIVALHEQLGFVVSTWRPIALQAIVSPATSSFASSQSSSRPPHAAESDAEPADAEEGGGDESHTQQQQQQQQQSLRERHVDLDLVPLEMQQRDARIAAAQRIVIAALRIEVDHVARLLHRYSTAAVASESSTLLSQKDSAPSSSTAITSQQQQQQQQQLDSGSDIPRGLLRDIAVSLLNHFPIGGEAFPSQVEVAEDAAGASSSQVEVYAGGSAGESVLHFHARVVEIAQHWNGSVEHPSEERHALFKHLLLPNFNLPTSGGARRAASTLPSSSMAASSKVRELEMLCVGACMYSCMRVSTRMYDVFVRTPTAIKRLRVQFFCIWRVCVHPL